MRSNHFLLAMLVVVVWGFNFVVITIGLEGIPPLLLAFSRFFLTSLLAIKLVKKPAVPMIKIVLYGLIMFALQFSLLFLGMSFGVSPGIASLVVQLQVVFSAVMAIIFFDEKLNKWRCFGIVIAFSGIAVVGMNLKGQVSLTGFLMILGAALASSTGYVISKKMGKINMVGLVVWGSLFAWPPLLLVSLLLEGFGNIVHSLYHMNGITLGAILYITFLSTLFGYASWSYLIHHYPLATVAPFTILVPIFAIISSIIVLGESFSLWKIIAAFLVVSGLGVNLFGSRLVHKKMKKEVESKQISL